MSIQKAAQEGILFTLQDAETVGNGEVIAIPAGFKQHSIYIRGIGAVGAGAIQIEAASTPDYSGTWAQVGGGPISVIAASTQIYNFSGLFLFLRARISTTVTGGVVSVYYMGAK